MKEEIIKKIKDFVWENRTNIVLEQDQSGSVKTGDFVRLIYLYDFLDNL